MTFSGPGLYPEMRAAGTVDSDAVLRQANLILADPLFRNSKRYSNLLRFIVDRTLKGQIDDLRERVIGIEVFRRGPAYDTSIDPTVRVAASEVRKRLALYYAEPGRESELRIEVPVRSYVAEFRVPESVSNIRHPTQAAEAVVQQDIPVVPASPKRDWLFYAGVAAVLVLLALMGWGLHRTLTPASALDAFWTPVTMNASSVLVCIGSTSVAGQNAVVPGSAVAPPATQSAAEELPPQRGNVPMMDVNVAVGLNTFLRAKVKDVTIRPAHGTSLSDLRSSPDLLIGSFDNEWTMRLGADLHFRFQRVSDQGLRWIENAADPGNRDWSVNLAVPPNQRGTDYALISRVFNRTTGQWWVGIGGLTGLGTLAAGQILTDPKAMVEIVAGLPKGWERKNVQMVLAIQVVQGSAGVPRVVSTYSW